MTSIEEELLDRYFLGPGSQGPIRSIFVSDEDLMEIFQVDDLAAARDEFIKRLPQPTSLARILAADWPPPRQAGGRPDYVRVLLFLCWMQVTKLRLRGERNFREILESNLGRQYVQLTGINALWRHLADFLKSQHDIELMLPNVLPHPQIGQTLRIAFPTWRDRALLRKLRIRLDPKDYLKPLVVANRILTAGDATNVAPSFQHYFQQWNASRQAGDVDADDSPFWRAWLAVVSEVSGNDRLELEVSEYGEVQLYAVAPDSRSTLIASPSAALNRVSDKIKSAIRRGYIYMEPRGFGRFRSIEQSIVRTLLVTADAVSDAAPGSILSRRPVSNDWSLVTFSQDLSSASRAPSPTLGLRWSNGIHIGGSYLGRTPLTPVLEYPSTPHLELDGSPIGFNGDGEVGKLHKGVYAGRLTATSGSASKSVVLVANAIEAHADRIATFNPGLEISEDGLLANTAPAGPMQPKNWPGGRVAMADEMTAISEALYSRSIRKMAAGKAFEIVSRGLEPTPGAPSAWDVLRSFVDASWLDMTSLRNVPAKQFLQRQLALLPFGPMRALLVGPTPIAVLERLDRAASASGVKMVPQQSASPYGLPLYSVQAAEDGAVADFCRRSQLLPTNGSNRRATLTEAAEDLSLEGYSCMASFSTASGYFDPCHTPGENGLYRFEHSSGSSRHLYVSYRLGEPAAKFSTLSIALLHHHSAQPLFSYSDHLVRPSTRRIRLPTAWARWLAVGTGANAGPSLANGTWSYAYPADPRSVQMLARALPMTVVEEGPPQWAVHALNSGGSKRRKLFINHELTSGRYRGVSK